MTVTIHVGHVLDVLRRMPAQSVQCIVTSPPYYGLRSYGIPLSIWGGDPLCAHVWGADVVDRSRATPGTAGSGLTSAGAYQAESMRFEKRSAFCQHCGAWRGHLGLEPTYLLYIDHMMLVFDELWRVLRDDGTAWVNVGDTYATDAGRVGDHPGGGPYARGGQRWSGLEDTRGYRGDRLANGRADQTAVLRVKTRADRDGDHVGKHTAITAMGPMTQPNRMPQPGLRAKNLIGIPWRIVFALQDRGWVHRSPVVWHKPAPMPESIWDRPTTAHEYVFLLAKSNDTLMWTHRDNWFPNRVFEKPSADFRWINRKTGEETKTPQPDKKHWKRINLWRGFDYYYDAAAIMEPASPNSHARAARNRSDDHKYADGGPGNQTIAKGRVTAGRQLPVPAGWNTDEGAHGSIHPDGRRPPQVTNGDWARPRKAVPNEATGRLPGVNPKAAASPHDGVDGPRPRQNDNWSAACGTGELRAMRNARTVWTIASEPFPEAHFATFPPPLPERCIKAGTPPGAVVLDPFFGAGTTGLVCDRLQRECIGIEYGDDYVEMAKRRIEGDSSLLARVEIVRIEEPPAEAAE